MARRKDSVLIKKTTRICQLIDFAVAANNNVKKEKKKKKKR